MKRSIILLLILILTKPLSSEEVIDLGTVVTYIPTTKTSSKSLKVTREDLEETTATCVADVLQDKGFLVMNTGGKGTMTNVSIAGYAAFCIKVYVDGVLANNPLTGEFDWNSIPLADVKSITVEHLPGDSPEFSGAIVCIETRLHEIKSTELSFSSRSYEKSLNDTLTTSFRHLNFLDFGGYELNLDLAKANNYYQLTPSRSGKERQMYGNETSSEALDLRFWRYLGNWQSDFSLKQYHSTVNTNNLSLSSSAGVETDNWLFPQIKFNLKSSDYTISLLSSYKFSGVTYDWKEQLGNYKTQDRTDINNAHVWYQEISGETKSIHLSSIFSWTSEAKFETYNYRNQLRLLLKWEPEIKDLKCRFQCNLLFIPELSIFQPILAAEFSWKWFSLSGYKQYVLPTFNQLYYAGSGGVGNPNLKPEEGWGLTFEYKPTSWLSFLYQLTYYEDKIRWSSGPWGWSPTNTSHALYNHFELVSSYSWDWIEYNLRVQHTRATLPEGTQIMWVPFWQANCSIAFKYKSFRLGLNDVFCGKRPKDNKNLLFYDPYNLLNVVLSYSLDKITMKFSVENLLDDRFIYHDNYPAASRSYSLFVTLKL